MSSIVFWVLRILTFIPFIILFPTRIVGGKNFPKGKAVVVCNHQSNLDPVILLYLRGRKLNFLAKKELFKNKFGGWFAKQLGAIPVNRENPEISSIKKGLEVLNKDMQLCIFPEGTRKKISFEEGVAMKNGSAMFALKTNAVVVPMVFVKKPRIFRFNKLVIGEPMYFEDYQGKKATKEDIAEVGELIGQTLRELKEKNTCKK